MHAADLSFRLNPSLALQAGQLGHVRPVSPRHAGSRKRAGPDQERRCRYFRNMVNRHASTASAAAAAAIAASLAALLRWWAADTWLALPDPGRSCGASTAGLRGGQTLATWIVPGAAIPSSLTVSGACDQEPKIGKRHGSCS